MTPIWVFVLTYLLLNGIAEGRKGFGSGDQEWGFVEVRPDAHMFWWLYYVSPPSEEPINVYEKPLIIWLEGGPGMSSTGFGNFELFGPLDINENPRNHTWVNDYNVLLIDSPVGTGFSYVKNETAYVRNNKQIADDLLNCVKGFFDGFPGFQNVSTYVAGESYGGKMAAEFGLVWYKAQKEGSIKSNFRGVALGNSWISPMDSMRSWAPFLLATGLIDKRGAKNIEAAVEETQKAVDEKNWTNATYLSTATIWFVVITETGNINPYNMIQKEHFPDLLPSGARNKILDSLMNDRVKKALGLDHVWRNFYDSPVHNILGEDSMKPVDKIVHKLVNETDLEVFVYNGQLDFIVPSLGTMTWVDRIFEGDEGWNNASRKPLEIDNVVEGYVKGSKNFKMYWIDRAGHMVPRDNPKAMAAMLKHLTSST